MIIPFRKKFEEIFSGQEKWYKKYLWFLLFLILISLSTIPAYAKEGVEFDKDLFLSSVGLFFFFATDLFTHLTLCDKDEQVKKMYLRALCIVGLAIIFIPWLLITIYWVVLIVDS